jgi:mannose-6-phosphate isomerase-like protein (cupin superfamily)
VRAFDVAHLDELDRFPVGEHGLTWRPIRKRFDVRSLGINAYSAEEAGHDVVEDHTESSGHQELYVVVRGRATFKVGEEEVDAPAGTMVYLSDNELRRGAQAAEVDTVVLAIGAEPGEAFSPSAWEHWFVAYPLADRGDLDGAIAELRGGLEARPEHPVLLYHLACVEARAGHRDEALGHARTALEKGAFLRNWARKDSDFDSLRDDPDLARLLGT